MSFLTTQPEILTAAASRLREIGAMMSANDAAAAAPTIEVTPAAADELSAMAATLFAAHGELYQAISAQAQRIHESFVTTLETSGKLYALTESTNNAIVTT